MYRHALSSNRIALSRSADAPSRATDANNAPTRCSCSARRCSAHCSQRLRSSCPALSISPRTSIISARSPAGSDRSCSLVEPPRTSSSAFPRASGFFRICRARFVSSAPAAGENSVAPGASGCNCEASVKYARSMSAALRSYLGGSPRTWNGFRAIASDCTPRSLCRPPPRRMGPWPLFSFG